MQDPAHRYLFFSYYIAEGVSVGDLSHVRFVRQTASLRLENVFYSDYVKIVGA